MTSLDDMTSVERHNHYRDPDYQSLSVIVEEESPNAGGAFHSIAAFDTIDCATAFALLCCTSNAGRRYRTRERNHNQRTTVYPA